MEEKGLKGSNYDREENKIQYHNVFEADIQDDSGIGHLVIHIILIICKWNDSDKRHHNEGNHICNTEKIKILFVRSMYCK